MYKELRICTCKHYCAHGEKRTFRAKYKADISLQEVRKRDSDIIRGKQKNGDITEAGRESKDFELYSL